MWIERRIERQKICGEREGKIEIEYMWIERRKKEIENMWIERRKKEIENMWIERRKKEI